MKTVPHAILRIGIILALLTHSASATDHYVTAGVAPNLPGSLSHAVANLSDGDNIYLQKGLYNDPEIVITNDNVTIVGYDASINNGQSDLDTSLSVPTSPSDYYGNYHNLVMPLFYGDDRTAGTAIRVEADGVEIRNINLTSYDRGVSMVGDQNVMKRVFASNLGDPFHSYKGWGLAHFGHSNRLEHCFVLNAGAEAVGIRGDHNVAEYCSVFTDDPTMYAATDYYFLVTANSNTSQAKHNRLSHCIVNRDYLPDTRSDGGKTHQGHGFCITTFYKHLLRNDGSGLYDYNPIYANDVATDNTIEFCDSYRVGEPVLLRGPGVMDNRIVELVSHSFGGLTLTSGAKNNRFTHCHVKNTHYFQDPNSSSLGFNAGVEFFASYFGNTTDQGVTYHAQGSYPWEPDGPSGNTFTNCLFENVSAGILLSSYSDFTNRINTKMVKDNRFFNCTFVATPDPAVITSLFYASRGNSGNKMVNCIVHGFDYFERRYFAFNESNPAVIANHGIIPTDFEYDHCNFDNNGFQAPSNADITPPTGPLTQGSVNNVAGNFISCNDFPTGFVNAVGNDFHLDNCANCGAVDQGLTLVELFQKYASDYSSGEPNDFFTDLDKLTRPVGGAFDIGAYEYR